MIFSLLFAMIDVITVWPRAYDYPIYRNQIIKNRDLFNKIIISFTHNDVNRDYRDFLKKVHPDFTYVDANNNDDWYDKAINKALDASQSEWVLFLEQDFFFTRTLLEKVIRYSKIYDFICHQQGKRKHLAFFLVKRSLIEKTIKYFGLTQELDCFDLFTREITVLAKENYLTLDRIGNCGIDFFHMNGLTHNYYLSISEKIKNITNPIVFKEYNLRSKKVKVLQNSEWLDIIDKVDKLIK
jgi:molybdopterin-guanine dinucleotide biosynthesis protein A